MRKHKKLITLGVSFIGLSIMLHGLHFAIFKDIHHLMIFLIADIAFIPLEVFFVSVVLEKMLEKHDDEQIRKKMNMLLGVFYQESGNKLLSMMVDADKCIDDVNNVEVCFTWTKDNYLKLANKIKNHNHKLLIERINLDDVLCLLELNKDMLIQLIMNPLLHEHESISEILMSTLHLYDELKQRNLESLSQEDLDHLTIDFERMYKYLSLEWVTYMTHLQGDYPYLFLAAVKSNPYDKRTPDIIELETMKTYIS